ncbi:Ig-like domain-containing protein [Curtobacterium sp. NPDC089689]|uniref:Ig-like domain-containing protein n=1 Tax=Curtobacterium sp. NPDC089689 TaxID=3363968 RepID=UPI00382265E3
MFRGQQEAGGRVRRRVVAGSVVLVALALVLPQTLPGGTSSPAVAASARQAAGPDQDSGSGQGADDPVRIAVPYVGKAEVSLGDGWSVSDCGRVNVPTGLTAACSSDSLSLTSKGFRADFGTVTMTVPERNGAIDLDVTYLVSLEPPTAPTLAKQTYDHPFEQGTTATVPYSDLGIRCDGCAAGPAMQVVSAEPAGVVATVTSTGLVVRPPAEWTGTASVRLRATDDQGGSGSATVRLVFVEAGRSDLAAQDTVRRLGADGTLRIDLSSLASARKGRVLFSDCGSAVTGTVVCSDRGVATYRPSGTMTRADQFSFHVRTASGDQATGSVTVLPRSGSRTAATATGTLAPAEGETTATGARYPATGLQTGLGTRSTRSVVATLPSEDDAADRGQTGLLTPLLTDLDRITEGSR